MSNFINVRTCIWHASKLQLGYSTVTHVTFRDALTHSWSCNSIIIDMNQTTFYHNKVDSLPILCIKTKLEKFYYAPGKSLICVGYSRYMIWTCIKWKVNISEKCPHTKLSRKFTVPFSKKYIRETNFEYDLKYKEHMVFTSGADKVVTHVTVTHVTFGDTFTHSWSCNSIIIDMNQATFYHKKVDSLPILCIKTKL